MDKRDKRVVAAAVAAAIIIAIAVLGAGWFFGYRDDAGNQAVGPTPAAPAIEAADSEGARTGQPQSAGTATPAVANPPTAQADAPQPSTAAPNATTQPSAVDAGRPGAGQTAGAGLADSGPATGRPVGTGQPGQVAESGVSRPAAGLATGNLLAPPDTTTAPPAQSSVSAPAAPAAPATPPGNATAGSPNGRVLGAPVTAGAQPTQAAASTMSGPATSPDNAVDAPTGRPSLPTTSSTPATPAGNAAADPSRSPPTAGTATGNAPLSTGTAAVPPAQTAAARPAAGGDPASPSGSVAATPSAGQAVLSDELVAALPSIRPPSFDVVRVNELGDAVIAGRAEPRSVVIIYDGDREIGRVAADSRGEWVFVSDRPLIPGQHEIGLLARSGPQSRLSDQVVVLIAPEPRQDIAGQATAGDVARERPLALLVPRDEIGATTVLQSPPAVVTERAPDDPASRPARPTIAATNSAPNAPTGPAAPTAPSRIAAPSVPTTGGAGPVSIDVVDYDEAGQLIVSGRSTPQSDVRLYLDNEYVGTARTGADGTFRVQPTEPVRPGVYALRIDEVSPVGSVTARAETPFQRANEVAAIPGFTSVVVQPGNSLWRLARRVYGHGIQYTVIYQANTGQIRNPDLIYPGQIFNVPEMPEDVPAGDPS